MSSLPILPADRPRLSPLVRKLAAKHSVPLEVITGTGVGGRIRKQDVLEAVSRPRQAIAKRMVESLQTPAQLTTVVEADVTNMSPTTTPSTWASRWTPSAA